MRYNFTWYFENEVLPRRIYLQKEWCIRVIEKPIRREVQINGRVRFWGAVDEFGGRFLRVITLSDGCTIHNAFFDRGFKP